VITGAGGSVEGASKEHRRSIERASKERRRSVEGASKERRRSVEGARKRKNAWAQGGRPAEKRSADMGEERTPSSGSLTGLVRRVPARRRANPTMSSRGTLSLFGGL
jgi:hypothetical protein